MNNIKEIANFLLVKAVNCTSEGNWIFDWVDIEERFNIKMNEEVAGDIADELESREEIADVQIYDEAIDLMLWGYVLEDDFVLNLEEK